MLKNINLFQDEIGQRQANKTRPCFGSIDLLGGEKRTGGSL